MFFFIPNRHYVNYMFWIFWVVSIILRYINDLYENLDLNVKYDLNIDLVSFIAWCCWDSNWEIDILNCLRFYKNIVCQEHDHEI
jgi:hypothetical protein